MQNVRRTGKNFETFLDPVGINMITKCQHFHLIPYTDYNVVELVLINTHNTGFGRKLMYLEIKCHHSLLSGSSIFRCFNPFLNKPWFLRVCCTNTSLLKTLGKGEIAHDEQFLLFPLRFLPFCCSNFPLFSSFVVCLLFQFGRVQHLSFGKGLRNIYGILFGKGLRNI